MSGAWLQEGDEVCLVHGGRRETKCLVHWRWNVSSSVW